MGKVEAGEWQFIAFKVSDWTLFIGGNPKGLRKILSRIWEFTACKLRL
jgi:hypothetical protein